MLELNYIKLNRMSRQNQNREYLSALKYNEASSLNIKGHSVDLSNIRISIQISVNLSSLFAFGDE